jgi:peptide deformylase
VAEIEGQVKDEQLDPEQEARRRLALAQIRQYPDSALKLAARPVEAFDDDLRRLADRMKQLMVDANGIGLAATQVGVLQRLFVFQVGEDEIVALANPEIVGRSEETTVDDEGCLSIQGVLVPVERSTTIAIAGRNEQGAEVRYELESRLAGRPARGRHLDGVLILDRTTDDAPRGAAKLRPRPVLVAKRNGAHRRRGDGAVRADVLEQLASRRDRLRPHAARLPAGRGRRWRRRRRSWPSGSAPVVQPDRLDDSVELRRGDRRGGIQAPRADGAPRPPSVAERLPSLLRWRGAPVKRDHGRRLRDGRLDHQPRRSWTQGLSATRSASRSGRRTTPGPSTNEPWRPVHCSTRSRRVRATAEEADYARRSIPTAASASPIRRKSSSGAYAPCRLAPGQGRGPPRHRLARACRRGSFEPLVDRRAAGADFAAWLRGLHDRLGGRVKRIRREAFGPG